MQFYHFSWLKPLFSNTIFSMDSSPAPTLPVSVHLSVIPGWVKSRGEVSDVDAAFMAGAALSSLDQLVRSEPIWSGSWRQRLGLKCAAAAVRLMGRTEDEAALRDAVLLRAPGAMQGRPEAFFWPIRNSRPTPRRSM